jgi:hypothetical protein
MNALRSFFLSLDPSKMMAKFMHFFRLSLSLLFLLFPYPFYLPIVLSFHAPFHIPFIPISTIPFEWPSYPHASSNILEMAKNSLYFPELDRNYYM